jgi:hypothetical protein
VGLPAELDLSEIRALVFFLIKHPAKNSGRRTIDYLCVVELPKNFCG